MAWPRAAVTAIVMEVAAVAGVAAAAVVVAKEMANAKQPVPRWRQKLNNQLSKSKNMAETMAEVVWWPSAEDGNVAMVAVAAKATAEGGGVSGQRGGGGDCSDS